jgi:hypothetical protein
MDDEAAFVSLAFVIESLERAQRRAADAPQATLRIAKLSVDLPVFVQERGPDTFVRFPRASDSCAATPLARLNISIGPHGQRQVIVESMSENGEAPCAQYT